MEPERREHFRISTRAAVSIRPLGKDQSPEELFPPSAEEAIAAQLGQIDSDLQRALTDLPPETRSALSLLSRKLDLIAGTLQPCNGEAEPLELSSGGLTLFTEQALTTGADYALRLEIPPDGVIRLRARCLHVQPWSGAFRNGFIITEIPEDAARRLSRHLFALQRNRQGFAEPD